MQMHLNTWGTDVSRTHQRVVVFRIDGLDVLHGQLLVEHPLIEGQRKAGVDEFSVIESHRDKATNELEVVEVVGVDVGRGVDLKGSCLKPIFDCHRTNVHSMFTIDTLG